MIQSSSSGRVAEALLRAQHRNEGQGLAELPRTFTIALTRQSGCPGTSVAREIGARLGWPVYDQELVARIAGEMGLRASLLESVDERHQSWVQECVESFATAPNAGESSYVRHLVETVLSLGARGECIIVGRGAAHILPRESTLRIRLVGLLDDRIRNMSTRLGIGIEEASRVVHETDHQRARFVRDHFHRDAADPAGYDLVLNTSHWSITECAQLSVHALDRLRARATR
jgi:cytidylate kinase